MHETRVKETLNLIFHGLKVSQREQMFTEVRDWLGEMDLNTSLARARVEDPVGVKLAEQQLDIRLSDFNPDKMLERMRLECDLREAASADKGEQSEPTTSTNNLQRRTPVIRR